MPKTGKARVVPMSPRLYEVLSEMAETRKKREGHWSDPGYVSLSPRCKRLLFQTRPSRCEGYSSTALQLESGS